MSPAGTVGRNLMGFVDGIINPLPGTPDFDQVVWNSGDPAWLRGGTGMVLRRVRVDVEGWSSLSRRERELAVGRDADSGAPLTGGDQSASADLNATDEFGLDVIPTFAHIRVAAPNTPAERVFRRSFNYDDGFVEGVRDQGSLFIAYAADPATSFIPIQQRLAEEDLMHTWLTATGSAVFAIPGGFEKDSWIGQSLLEG
jgi:dye decolorizing peroxidase